MIILKKPFHYMKEKDYGVCRHSIVTFSKQGILFKDKDMGNGMGKTFTAQYKYFLRIDLFFFIIDLSWKGKEREDEVKPFFDTMKPFRDNIMNLLLRSQDQTIKNIRFTEDPSLCSKCQSASVSVEGSRCSDCI